ncbi:MAG: WecB/TagA/CpsF family glycosyltransferase [Phycisphaerales bacterium]|nr:WecB/TagA/CpsF family glycosyltransferase [Phycisphaerales bacterium]
MKPVVGDAPDSDRSVGPYRDTSPHKHPDEVSPTPARVVLCGVSIDALTLRQTVDRVRDTIKSGGRLAIGIVNVAKLVNMRRDPLLRESVESSDIVLADGAPLVWLSRWKGTPLPERVAGIDLMYELFKLADEHALRVYLLGARRETLSRVVQIARRDYPRMIIAGCRDGYFTPPQEEEVARDIRDARAHILLVAMSSPKKEFFMKRWAAFFHAPVCHGVGGSFDVMAGITRRAPRWMQRCGLEWFFRVLQEPRRMWKRYLVTNTVFIAMAARDLWDRRSAAKSRE